MAIKQLVLFSTYHNAKQYERYLLNVWWFLISFYLFATILLYISLIGSYWKLSQIPLRWRLGIKYK